MALAEPIKNSGGYTKKHKKRSSRIKEKTIEQITKENIQLEILSKEIPVTPDFIEENKKLLQTTPNSKKGGPYPKHVKKERRDEVFKLHFDYGYSARKIADMMKISRNTINSDISFCYSQLEKEKSRLSTEGYLNKLLYRLELQRTRCIENMEKIKDSDDTSSFEKMIFDIDCKLVQIIMKLQTSNQSNYDRAMNILNDYLEKNGYDTRYTLWGDALRVSTQTRKKIKDLLKSEKHQYG